MINIQASQVITYGHNQTVTVYQDFIDTHTYYIVPEPVIPLNDEGLPEFALLSYSTGSEVTGTCSFQTELQVSADALKAVTTKLGGGIKIGQLDWQSVKVLFHFATATDSAMMLIATPSMYGNNRGSFIIHLPDNATFKAFEAAFGPGGSAAGAFMLEYDVTTLTRLPPATVTVNFNSQTAFDYQRKVKVKKNTWGHVTSRTVSITEHLQQSKAGTITVDPGSKPLDADTKKRLMDWGNATLQNDVEQAVSTVTQMMNSTTAPTFNMSQISSFHTVYTEDQIVPWIITPRASIPAFSKDVWAKVSKSVSIRPMNVAFTVQDLKRNGVASINLVVTYPAGSTVAPAKNTHLFSADTPSSWIFTAPGQSAGGVFNGHYTYHYVVNYADGSAPFLSDEIPSDQSEIHITANDLNILLLEFMAENVPFKETQTTGSTLVDYLLIDMFFVNQATGQLIQMQQAKLTAAKQSIIFKSTTHEPFSNPCSYRLTYVLSTAQQVVIDWQTTTLAAPKTTSRSRVPMLVINSPFQLRTITLFPMEPEGKNFDMMAIHAEYSDRTNNLNEQHDWSLTTFKAPPETWNFLAPANQNGQIVNFSGTYVLDGTPAQLGSAKTPLSMFILNPDRPLFSVTIDPSQIEWDISHYTQVVVTLFTMEGKNKTNVVTLTAFHEDNNQQQLYSFYFKAGETPECYFKAEYWIKDEPIPAIIEDTKLSAMAQLTLPGQAPALSRQT